MSALSLAGQGIALACLVNLRQPQNLVLRLYTNDYTPHRYDKEQHYVEASGFGYSSYEIDGAAWTLKPGYPLVVAAPTHTFKFTGALGDVYGYYLTQLNSGFVVYAERFPPPGPYHVRIADSIIEVTPQIESL